jgi:hypothetical protein
MNKTNETTDAISMQQISGLTLSEKLKIKRKKLLIIDISGSMNEEIEPGVTKTDAVKDIVKSIIGNKIVFNSEARLLDVNEEIPNPSSGTVMSKAFKLAKSLKYKEAIMLTDGNDASYDQEIALDEVGEGMLKLQIMYIGAGERPAFLDKLAAKAGGFCTTEDLKMTKELETKLQLLLGSSDTGPICL